MRNYHRNYRASRRFHAPSYRRPSGWYYRRWSWGDMLPSLFWSNQYWINDYGLYDLPPPPPGTVWVRYGDDAILIDRYNGEIIQVAYGIFY
jgi:Ni/Co efflux regulator RcnB